MGHERHSAQRRSIFVATDIQCTSCGRAYDLWRHVGRVRVSSSCPTHISDDRSRYDEGTAFMPVVSYASQLPVHPSFRFVALDVDGHDLPSDWYMRIMGFAAEGFHGQRTLLDTFPVKELQDYWSTRPRDGDGGQKKEVDVEGVTRAFRAWEVSEGNVGALSDAPPPYSLEDAPSPQEPGPQMPWMQQQQSGRTGPPVRQDTRPSPSPSHSLVSAVAGAAAFPLAAAAVSYTERASPSLSAVAPPPRHTPPHVNLSSRPPPSTRPSYHAPGEFGMTPPLPLRPGSSSLSSPDRAHAGYDLGRHHSPAYHPHHSGHVSSLGHARIALPSPGVEHARGRSSSRSRSRSRSRSSSHSPKRKHKLKRKDKHKHGHSHSHGHGHSLSPVGSSHAMAFPGAGAVLYDAYSGGPYTPVHSHPVGHGGHATSGSVAGYAHGQQAYGQGQGHPGHYPSPNQHQHQAYDTPGYGYGQGQGHGQGYDAHQQQQHQQGYGYAPSACLFLVLDVYGLTWTTDPPSGYYGSYVPGAPYAGGPSGSGGGGGGLQGGIASALQAVEGIAGRQTRLQLEKTVKSLSGCRLFFGGGVLTCFCSGEL